MLTKSKRERMTINGVDTELYDVAGVTVMLMAKTVVPAFAFTMQTGEKLVVDRKLPTRRRNAIVKSHVDPGQL